MSERSDDTRRDTGTGWPEPEVVADAETADHADRADNIEDDVAAVPDVRAEDGTRVKDGIGAEDGDDADADADADVDVDVEDGDGVPADGGGVVGPASRFSVAGAVIGLLLGLLGFALVVQLRSNATDGELASARPEDLVRILSDLDARQDRLRSELTSLEESRRQLASGAQGREAALAEARRRADELGILAGTLPAHGPGLTITFQAGREPVRATTLLDAVQELRGAGAEAMQIGGADGTVVRIIASTYFVDDGDGIEVDGRRLSGPYTLAVIGEPKTMETALNIPEGVVDAVRKHGGNVIVQEAETVRVDAIRTATSPRYAQPTS